MDHELTKMSSCQCSKKTFPPFPWTIGASAIRQNTCLDLVHCQRPSSHFMLTRSGNLAATAWTSPECTKEPISALKISGSSRYSQWFASAKYTDVQPAYKKTCPETVLWQQNICHLWPVINRSAHEISLATSAHPSGGNILLLHPIRLRHGTEICERSGRQSSCVWSAINFAKWPGLHFKVSDTSRFRTSDVIGRLAHTSQPPATRKQLTQQANPL